MSIFDRHCGTHTRRTTPLFSVALQTFTLGFSTWSQRQGRIGLRQLRLRECCVQRKNERNLRRKTSMQRHRSEKRLQSRVEESKCMQRDRSSRPVKLAMASNLVDYSSDCGAHKGSCFEHTYGAPPPRKQRVTIAFPVLHTRGDQDPAPHGDV